MELTIGKLKQIIADLPDDTLLATLEYGNDNFRPFVGIKRVLLLRDKESNKDFLTINSMGSHFTGEGHQKSLEYVPGNYWDYTTFQK